MRGSFLNFGRPHGNILELAVLHITKPSLFRDVTQKSFAQCFYYKWKGGKSGVIDHLIPAQTDHPKLSAKSESFRGHFYGYKVG